MRTLFVIILKILVSIIVIVDANDIIDEPNKTNNSVRLNEATKTTTKTITRTSSTRLSWSTSSSTLSKSHEMKKQPQQRGISLYLPEGVNPQGGVAAMLVASQQRSMSGGSGSGSSSSSSSGVGHHGQKAAAATKKPAVKYSCAGKEDEGHYENADCKKYWQCLYVGTIFETAVERKCPIGTMFHPIERVCEISTMVDGKKNS